MRLDQLVLERGLVGPETLARARLVQTETGERLDSVLTRLGMVAEQALAETIAGETGFPIVHAADFPQEAVAAESISVRFLRDLKALPPGASDDDARKTFANLVDPLLEVSKCPDFVVNRGHYFGTDYFSEEPGLSDQDKRALIEFLKTL